jgi:hypothetical protein
MALDLGAPKSLSALATLVLQHLTATRQTTFAAVADAIVRSAESPARDDRGLRRRVYDILNVLLACRMIDKTKTHICITAARPCEAEPRSLAEKRERLRERSALLAWYRALIERNRRMARPPRAIQLPALFVSFRDLANGSTEQSLDRRSLTLTSASKPCFYSPMDVLGALAVRREEEKCPSGML